jgi:DNA polymerase I
VHDELVLEVDEAAVDRVRTELCERMSNAAELKVALVVEAGAGENWDAAH